MLPHLTARHHPQVDEEIDYYFRVIRDIPAVNRPAAVGSLLRFFLPTFQHLVRALGPGDLDRRLTYRGRRESRLIPPPGRLEPFREWQMRVVESARQIVGWIEQRAHGATSFPLSEVEIAAHYIEGLWATIPPEGDNEALRRLAMAYGISADLVPVARTRWTLAALDLVGVHLALAMTELPDADFGNLGQLLLAFVPFRGRVSGRRHWIDTPDGPYEIGPNPELAQTWSPPWLVDAFWRGVRDCGWSPGTERPLIAELAAGNGRLIDPVSEVADWILNDIDPAMAEELRQRFLGATVYCGDFRDLDIGLVDAAIGAPPWIDDDNGIWLPQAYAETCAACTGSGGLVGLILPEGFEPEVSSLQLRHEAMLDPERMAQWPFPERPAIHYYERKP